ncbi:MAG: glycosyltransferase family 4 protein [Bacillota bacterium]
MSLELAKALSPHVTLRAFISANVENLGQWQKADIDICPMHTLEATSLLGVLGETALRMGWLKIRRELSQYQPDIVHATMLHPWLPLVLAGGIHRSRIVFTVHDPKPHPGEASLPLIWLNRLCMVIADRRVVLTDTAKQSLIAQGFAPETIDIVPLGELSYYRDVGVSSGTQEAQVVLFFGRILAYKGLDHLFRAFPMVHASLPQARLVVAGEGDLRPYARLMRLCPNLEVHNHWIPDHLVSSLFSRATVVVLPYVEASQSGIVSIAASMGIPVVATQVGGLVEQVTACQAGLLVPPADPEALARALISLLTDDRMRLEISSNAKAVSAGTLSWSRIAQAQLDSYRRAQAQA